MFVASCGTINRRLVNMGVWKFVSRQVAFLHIISAAHPKRGRWFWISMFDPHMAIVELPKVLILKKVCAP